MRIFLISTFTLAIYAGQADAQPPAEATRPASTQAESDEASRSQARDHARAAQRMARARHATTTTTRSDGETARPGGLPLSETVVSAPADPSSPDPDR